MKGKVYKSCIRSVMLYGSETWCLRERVGNFEKTDRAMLRGMCSVKLMDRRNTEKLMAMLGPSLDMMAKVSSMWWYGHILRREEDNVLLKALHFELLGCIRRRRPKPTWKKQVQKEMHKNGLVMKDACNQDKC